MTPSIPELRGLAERCLAEAPMITIETPDGEVANFVTHSPHHVLTLLDRLQAAEERAERLQADLNAEDDETNAIYQRVKKDADAAIKAAIGPCWNHLWGPGLEQLGHIVDAGMERALRAESQRDAAVAVLRSVEWVSHSEWCACPACHADSNESHEPDCPIAAALLSSAGGSAAKETT